MYQLSMSVQFKKNYMHILSSPFLKHHFDSKETHVNLGGKKDTQAYSSEVYTSIMLIIKNIKFIK